MPIIEKGPWGVRTVPNRTYSERAIPPKTVFEKDVKNKGEVKDLNPVKQQSAAWPREYPDREVFLTPSEPKNGLFHPDYGPPSLQAGGSSNNLPIEKKSPPAGVIETRESVLLRIRGSNI